MSDSDYVTNDAWLRTVGRPDHIDEIADHYERPLVRDAQPFPATEPAVRWPRTPRGWRSRDLLGHRSLERQTR